MTTDLLEERLQKLSVEIPDAERVTAHVLSRASRRRSRRFPRTLATAIATFATLVMLVLVAYFVPAADTAVASVPFAGDLLRDAGLVGASGRITSVGSESTSSGYRLKLVGAYADSARTVLLLHSDPPIDLGGPTPWQLTDQFGRTYHEQGGAGNLQTGDTSVQFEALAWPDDITGARLTLHISSLQTASETGPGQTVFGTWTLPAILGVDESTVLPTPADANLGPARFHFKSATYTPASIAVNVDVTGVSFAQLGRIIPDGLKGTPAFTMDMIDPNGENITGTSQMNDDVFGTVHIQFLAFRLGGGGDFMLHVSYAGEGQFARVLTIP
jgi:hypothetical protein